MSQFKVGDLVIIKEAFEAPYALSKDTIYCVWNLTGMGSIGLVGKPGSYGEEYFELFEQPSSKSINIQEEKKSALDKQISGDHYKGCGIQPIEYIHANGLNYFEGNAVKYITRHRKKNGKADIEKAIHYLELMLELEYKEDK